MKKQDYHASLSVNVDAGQVFERINDVAAWWAKNVEGKSEKVNDVFTVHLGETSVTFKVTEFALYSKITWLVTDCNLHWLHNKKEWQGTQVQWTIEPKDNSSKIHFTHVGLVPEIECYDNCEKGWNFYVKKSLLKLLTEQKGLPDTPQKAR